MLSQRSDGGWMASHPIPGDKGAINSFTVLTEQNWQVLRNLLESDTAIYDDSWDDQLLRKLRTLYASCMDEVKLDYLGQAPLQQFVNTIREIYRGRRVDLNTVSPRQGLSNALGYMHSRGKCCFKCVQYSMYICPTGVDALFEFFVDGDAGVDPNAMTLWFTQPTLGLPSKVRCGGNSFVSLIYSALIRNTTRTKACSVFIKMSLSVFWSPCGMMRSLT